MSCLNAARILPRVPRCVRHLGAWIYSWSSRWCEFTFRLASAIYERLLSSCPQNATPLDEECAASNVSVGCISTELIQAIIALSSSVA
jgi:hypothetical protein